eukprot:Selendium_serpulae@DN5130_c0_g1_i4.p1
MICFLFSQMVAVDVYVPRPIQMPLIPVGRSEDQVQRVNIPDPQYNTLLMNLNTHCTNDPQMADDLPFKRNADSTVPALTADQYNATVTTLKDETLPFSLKKNQEVGRVALL